MRAGFWLPVVLLALAAGCGGSSSKSSQPTTSTKAAVTTEAAKTTTAAPTLKSFATSKNCQKLAGLGETFAKALQAGTSGDATLADEAKAFETMANAAPSEIRGAFKTLAGAFSDYAKAMKDAGVTTGTTPTPAQLGKLVKAAQSFSTADVKAAQEKISTWAAANCGVATTTTG